MNACRLILAATVIACATRLLAAHHTLQATYDTAAIVSLSGTIAKVELVNPHVAIELEVQGADGTVATWSIEMAAPGALQRRKVDLKVLRVGTHVTVESWIASDGRKQATGRTLITAAGHRLDVRDNWPDVVFPRAKSIRPKVETD